MNSFSALDLKILRFNVEDPEEGARELDALLKPDPEYSAGILKVANSALYGRSGKIRTTREAISLLGVKRVKNIVVLISTTRVNAGLRGKIYDDYLREFPVLSALIALDLCRPMGLSRIMEEAFMSALLFRFGMTIIALENKVHYASLLSQPMLSPSDLWTLEARNFGATHVRATVRAFRGWNLPDSLLETARAAVAEEMVDVTGDLCAVTIIASHKAAELLSLTPLCFDQGLIYDLCQSMDYPMERLDAYNGGYLEEIKEHPFYEQVMTGAAAGA